jgi:hypothetical protein
MDKEDNNLAITSKCEGFNKTMETTDAITQANAFLEAGVKFLASKNIYSNDPHFNGLLNLYVETAKNSYKTSLDNFIPGVTKN